MIAWILDIAVFPLVFGLGAWVWSTQQALTRQCTEVKSLQTEVTRVYEEGTKKLQEYLRTESGRNRDMAYMQQDMGEVKANIKDMQAQMTQLLLMQRDLLNEVKRRSPVDGHPE